MGYAGVGVYTEVRGLRMTWPCAARASGRALRGARRDDHAHHVPVDAAEAVLVVLVAAHEVEFVASMLAGPLDLMREQHPARRELHVLAADAGVVGPQLVAIVKVK